MTYSELHPTQKRLVISLLKEIPDVGEDTCQQEIVKLQEELRAYIRLCPITATRHIYEVAYSILEDTFWSLVPDFKDYNANNTIKIILKHLDPEMGKVGIIP